MLVTAGRYSFDARTISLMLLHIIHNHMYVTVRINMYMYIHVHTYMYGGIILTLLRSCTLKHICNLSGITQLQMSNFLLVK